MLANVDRLALDQASAVGAVPRRGRRRADRPRRPDRRRPPTTACPGCPRRSATATGDFAARKAVAHPAPATFTGPVLPPFAQGDAPPLAEADLFAYRRLEPVAGRLGLGPARHRRPLGRRAARGAGAACCCWPGRSTPRGAPCRSTPTSSRSSTSGPSTWPAAREPRAVRPGEPLVFDLDPAPAAGRHVPARPDPRRRRPAAPR